LVVGVCKDDDQTLFEKWYNKKKREKRKEGIFQTLLWFSSSAKRPTKPYTRSGFKREEIHMAEHTYTVLLEGCNSLLEWSGDICLQNQGGSLTFSNDLNGIECIRVASTRNICERELRERDITIRSE
jgi:hypothetical protein